VSLGNQKRVQLAVALAHDPEVLVLDEPFSGLDPIGVDALAGVLAEKRDAGVPIIFPSHQLDLVKRLSDSVGIIAAARIVAAGPVDEVRARAAGSLLRVRVRDAAPGWAGVLIGLVVTALVVVGAIAGPRLLGSPDTYKVGVTGQAGQALRPGATPTRRSCGSRRRPRCR
jgi:ABC-type molybdate transport system ATPase subunit